MKTLLEVFFSGNVLSSSPCKHSNMTFWMKTQNGGLVAFAHSSYCLTIHWLLVLFIDHNILEEQDTSPLKGIKTYGCFQKCARISTYFVFTFSQSVHSPECLTLYSHVSVSKSSTSSLLHWKKSYCLPRRVVIFDNNTSQSTQSINDNQQ